MRLTQAGKYRRAGFQSSVKFSILLGKLSYQQFEEEIFSDLGQACTNFLKNLRTTSKLFSPED